MSLDLRQRLYDQLSQVVLIDPHTHINALNPASQTPADILGYHYYTELAHSAGMPRDQIEEPDLDPKEKVARLIANLGPIDNTIQYSWFVEMAQALFGFEGRQITADNWEPIYDRAVAEMSQDDWPDTVLSLSKLEAVFLTNDFDDPLEGFDTQKYIPCLRTDDLVFHLAKPEVRDRLAAATGFSGGEAGGLVQAIGQLFEHFCSHGARACAISLPPDFAPCQVSAGRANTALANVYAHGLQSTEADRRAVANFVFWTLAQYCADYRLPFDLMIGVNRGVYEQGVYQGQDLYDSRVSLIQYKALFNAFPQVTFPISVLASVTNQELASYAWIFPNVVTNGHWWYSNTPTFIEHDAAARLEAVPRTKQIAYYSDMYKLEFALPKFNMYKRILAKILAEGYVIDRGWSEEQAIALGTQVLRGNVESIFRMNEDPITSPELVAAGGSPPLAAVMAAPTESIDADEIETDEIVADEIEAESYDADEPIDISADLVVPGEADAVPPAVGLAGGEDDALDDIFDFETAESASAVVDAAEAASLAELDDVMDDVVMDIEDEAAEEVDQADIRDEVIAIDEAADTQISSIGPIDSLSGLVDTDTPVSPISDNLIATDAVEPVAVEPVAAEPVPDEAAPFWAQKPAEEVVDWDAAIAANDPNASTASDDEDLDSFPALSIVSDDGDEEATDADDVIDLDLDSFDDEPSSTELAVEPALDVVDDLAENIGEAINEDVMLEDEVIEDLGVEDVSVEDADDELSIEDLTLDDAAGDSGSNILDVGDEQELSDSLIDEFFEENPSPQSKAPFEQFGESNPNSVDDDDFPEIKI